MRSDVTANTPDVDFLNEVNEVRRTRGLLLNKRCVFLNNLFKYQSHSLNKNVEHVFLFSEVWERAGTLMVIWNCGRCSAD